MPIYRFVKLFAIIWGLIFCATGRAQCTKMVITADPTYPPLHYYDGTTLKGASIEIAKRVLEDLKIPYEIRYVGPLARVLLLATRGEVDMVTTLKKNSEREEFLLYPKTAALANPVAVFSARARDFSFNGPNDLIGLRGGITRGAIIGVGIDEFMKEKLIIEEANSPKNNFDKLGLGRLDYFITGYFSGMAMLLKNGDEERFVAKKPFLSDAPNFLVLTKRGKCADKLDAIDARLAVLKKNGVLEELIQAGFRKWKSNPVSLDH